MRLFGGHVNLIKRHGQAKPEIIPQSLDYIDAESRKIQELVNELLTLGRIDRPQSLAKPINLIPIVKEVIAEIHTVYPQSIHTKLPDQLNFAIQENDFRNIVHNLVENAAKYSPADSAIKVTLAKQNDQLLLEVADHGQGIALQNREKIFDRFYREDQAHSSKIKGSGLGLAIVKAEVDKYHGQIKVTDNLPQGTIFTVVLPIEK